MEYEKKYNDLIARINAVKDKPRIGVKDEHYYNGYVETGIRDALDYITSLQQEQPEVELEKALDEYYKNADFGPSEAIEYEIHKNIARHFYELGLNARKEE